jgi:hypothetical protein
MDEDDWMLDVVPNSGKYLAECQRKDSSRNQISCIGNALQWGLGSSTSTISFHAKEASGFWFLGGGEMQNSHGKKDRPHALTLWQG